MMSTSDVGSINSINLEAKELEQLKQPIISLLTQVQPHGLIFVLQEPDLTILQVSRNTSKLLGMAAETIVGHNLEEILDSFQVDQFKAGLFADNLELINPSKVWIRCKGDDYVVFDAVFHRSSDGFLVLELEPAFSQENIPFLSFYHLAKASINQIETTSGLHKFCQVIVQEVRQVTGFDRVMLYRFDVDGHGEVVAEDKIEEMESYLGLHYPESDIPATARKMFLSNWIRVIPDAKAQPVELYPIENPLTQYPTDLTHSILRSAYPCHLEYLENMGVGASLTISLMKDQKLWGLIACHHATPRYIPYELRKACEFLGRVIFSEISTREEEEDFSRHRYLSEVHSILVDRMSKSDNFIDGLMEHHPNLLDLVNAHGAAICFNGRWQTIGRTPKEEELNYLLQWLAHTVKDEVFYTNSLPALYSDAHRFKDLACGLLAIPISKRSYVLWFRPEVIQTVNWGGDPNNAYRIHKTGDKTKLCPRKSFNLWKETVQLTSLRWELVEITAALDLRKAIVNIVLRQAEELAILAQDLARSNAELKKFAYIASHDLQEPLNQVANYVQLLEMRYNDKLDEDGQDFIDFAVEGVSLMQTLIDDILVYSKVDLQGLEWKLTDLEIPLNHALGNLRGRIAETNAIITYDPLPTIMADSTQIMQLFQNLVGNAIKFQRPHQPPRIHIAVQRQEMDWLFSVQDNGIGLDTQFADRIFVIFQRLHTRDEYAGSGMGLAICKKIIECHRGQIWVKSTIDQGSNFEFTIPIGGNEPHVNGHHKPSYQAQTHSSSRRQSW
jgi:two-component system, chemotaxis family, sensor kinase Cph1